VQTAPSESEIGRLTAMPAAARPAPDRHGLVVVSAGRLQRRPTTPSVGQHHPAKPVRAREPGFRRSPAIPRDPELIYDALHLGRHKCASTYLQRSGLASHPEVDLVWRDHKATFYEFWEHDFGSDVEAFLDRLRGTPRTSSKPTARVRIFSNEGFCGDMFTGRSARLIADLTVKAFGAINCFLIVREPYSYVYSVWNQYIQEGGVLSLRDFLLSATSPTWSRTRNESLLWHSARSMDLIRYWTTLLGPDKFCVSCSRTWSATGTNSGNDSTAL